MIINLFDEKFKRLRRIGGDFISLLWQENYNSRGNFVMELAETPIYMATVKPEYYVTRSDRRTVMVIKTVEAKDGKIVASGYTADRQLDDVAFVGTIEAGSAVARAIKKAYSQTAGYPGIEIGDSDISVTYGSQISNKSFYELLKVMCRETDLGYSAEREQNSDKVTIRFYRPEQDKNLKFASSYGNLANRSLLLSTATLKNCAVVLGEGEGEERIKTEVDLRENTSEPKKQLIVDAKDLQRQQEESEESYIERLKARGREKLLEKTRNWEVGFEPQAQQFGKKFGLGDIIKILLPEFGMTLDKRIVSFSEKTRNNRTELTVSVGDIVK